MTTNYRSILELGSERAVADLAVSALEAKPEEFCHVLNLCFLDQYPLSMRAARVIQLYCEKYTDSIYPFLEETVNKMLSSKIDGVRRNFLKIYSEFIDINRIKDPGPLVTACFDWLQDPKEKPAIKIHALNVIIKISINEPDLLKELSAVLDIIGDEGEISFRHHVKNLRGKIHQSAIKSQQPAFSNPLTHLLPPF